MFFMKSSYFVLVLLLAAMPSRADLIINIYEEAGNVVFDYSGSVNLDSTLQQLSGEDGTSAAYIPSAKAFEAVTGPSDRYQVSFTASPVIGTTDLTGGVHTGDNLLVWDADVTPQLYLPSGYISESQISGKVTFTGETLADGGLTVGTSSTWTWEAGPNSDSVTFNVIPEPTVVSLILGGGIGMITFRRIRSRRERLMV